MANDKIPRGLRGVPSTNQPKTVTTSASSLQAEAAQLERWWSEPRWKYTKRVYKGTYHTIVCLGRERESILLSVRVIGSSLSHKNYTSFTLFYWTPHHYHTTTTTPPHLVYSIRRRRFTSLGSSPPRQTPSSECFL